MTYHWLSSTLCAAALLCSTAMAQAATRIRIMPPDGAVLAAGQLVDIRVEATAEGAEAPRDLIVTINGTDVTNRNMVAPTEKTPPTSTNFMLRGFSMATPGTLLIEARTADGASASARLTVAAWDGGGAATRAKNIIVLVGDGMGAAHRTGARLVSRGLKNGRAAGRLAMDDLDVTGMVMTASLNAAITDSSPGMSAYVTGQKANNNQSGVFPDNTPDPFDNPRVEYLGEMLRRIRGEGFGIGIVTTADVTDSTPAANAVHTADRYAGPGIAERLFDERHTNGLRVLLGGGRRHFVPRANGGTRPDDRDLLSEFAAAGYTSLDAAAIRSLPGSGKAPANVIGLLHPSHLPVAYDKVGAGRYSDELMQPPNAEYRDTPMLEDLTAVALGSLSTHSPDGFYLMVEGASIDKRAHAVDAERTVWDVIELDRAVAVAMEFARVTNADADPTNDTLVIVTADHETGGMAVVGIGNERYAPQTVGKAVRDYVAVLRFEREQQLELTPNYVVDERGFPVDPDPSRKILLGWAAGADHYENWLGNRRQMEATIAPDGKGPATADPSRDGPADRIPGFLVQGVIENGATPCPAADGCPADTKSVPHTISGHTASDVPLSAAGPGALQFTGVFENTDVFLKLLRATSGTYQR